MLAIFADDHDDIAALQVKVAEQDKQIKSLDAKTRLTDARVGTLTTTVDTDQKELKQLTVDISNESTERVKIFNDLKDTVWSDMI